MSSEKILLVEDDTNDVELILMALTERNLADTVTVVRDGVEALDYLYRRGQFAAREGDAPAVIFLDLKMPRIDGLEVLRQIKSDQALSIIPVVILTSSREEQDIVRSYSLGANAYVVKPVHFDQFVEVVQQLGLFWVLINEAPTRR